jgi:hypothetical protein
VLQNYKHVPIASEHLQETLYIFFLNGRNGDFGEKSLPTTYLNDHLNIDIFHSAASSFGWCLMAGAGLF